MRNIKNIQDEINFYGITSLVMVIIIAVIDIITKVNILFSLTLVFIIMFINLYATLIEKRQTIIYKELDNKLSYIIKRLNK